MSDGNGNVDVWGFGARRRPLTGGGVLLEYERVGSTMDVARECVLRGNDEVVGVRAEYQSAGRGRLGSPWLAPPGECLLATYILREGQWRYGMAGRLAFAAGLAVCEAIEEVAEFAPSVKWPNDVLVGGRKLAGVLVEMCTTGVTQNVALTGIGLNVNIERFPDELRGSATSLEVETSLLYDVLELEEAVRTRLFGASSLSWPEVLCRWRARDATVGWRYQTMLDGREVGGVAEGVTDEGALRLRVDGDRTVETLAATSVR